MRLDERSGAFFGVGMALAGGAPVVVVTTSGTAVAELHAGVVEADQACIPLIIATADRPVELQHVGAPQTIDQSAIFGHSLRYQLDLPVAEEANRIHWRSFAARLVAEATTNPRGPGPVHVNIAYREPMVGRVGSLPAGREGGQPWHESVREVAISSYVLDRFLDEIEGVERGVILVGGNPLADTDSILSFAMARGWPVVGDARAIRRASHDVLIAHADQFLRIEEVVEQLVPQCVVHLGSPHASKTLTIWNKQLAVDGVRHLFIDPYGSFEDPERYGSLFLGADPVALCSVARQCLTQFSIDEHWLSCWRNIDDATEQAIATTLASDELSEPAIARLVFACLGQNDTLVCSSSMPIRDVEWFAPLSPSPARVLANRGANGIDGVVSTVLGAATVTDGRTVALIGDLALLHDLSGFVWGTKEEMPTSTIVLIDNDGGGIFSFLSYPDLVGLPTFERAFGTPQRGELTGVLRSLGCQVTEVNSCSELTDALHGTKSNVGISVIVAKTQREANVDIHRMLTAAIKDALTG
jgi:2-succinyl-5-enolpyruvyl-6-hydroxy-3-cyclohexene-1-carboxylate synthase